MILGIDLGTTNSAAAYMTDEGPRLIPNALGESLTPSVVGINPQGELLVGRAARELQVTHPDRCASTFKRKMGLEWNVSLDGHAFTPEKLSGLVLKSLKQDAEAFLSQPIEQAVITVPAYFNEPQRKATIEAGKIAGLHVLRILNEPTAAAIAYGFHESRQEKTLVVVDLGGGTFDVSVVDMFEGMVEVRSSSGDSFLGGEDFTSTLAARVLESQGFLFESAEMQHPLMVARMRSLCETAKRRLSTQDHVAIRVANRAGELPEGSPEVAVTREAFQTWTECILRRIDLPLQRALGDAQLRPSDVSEIILVGGATRMPAVVQRLERYFGRAPQQRLNPDEVVALGAAVQAGLIGRSEAVEDLVVTDVAPFTLGIETTKQLGGEYHDGYMLPIIHRNTTIPISRVKRVTTLHANQTEVRVMIYQGENRLIKHNLLLGEFTLDGIPKGPPGQEIDVRFTYDLNGVIEVEATVVQTKRKMTHLVTRYARGMSAQQIKQAVAELQSLKTPPRDEAVHHAMLTRANRLYEELPLEGQSLLGQLLDGYEDALESGDKEAIERFRQAIQEFLDAQDQSWEGD
jgi:molecular chaperone HscC